MLDIQTNLQVYFKTQKFSIVLKNQINTKDINVYILYRDVPMNIVHIQVVKKKDSQASKHNGKTWLFFFDSLLKLKKKC